jgi:hypothetical protein
LHGLLNRQEPGDRVGRHDERHRAL